MTWLQENWIAAVVIAIVAIAILWWLLARPKADDVAPPAAPPKPAKPLEPAKPDIVAAEPARFKPVEPAPAPQPVAPPPVAAPAPQPVPTPPPVVAEPVPVPPPAAAPASPAAADNLQLLKGVGPKLVALLASLGVTRFDQIAAWTDADIAAIDPQLGNFSGRIVRDNWVDQAGYLARRDKAGFEAKYGALGGEL